MQEMKAFWLPSKTPEARRNLEKPDLDTICPATGKKLALKSLISVRFTRLSNEDEGFAMDPVTKDVFSNSSRLVVLKPTGKSQCYYLASWSLMNTLTKSCLFEQLNLVKGHSSNLVKQAEYLESLKMDSEICIWKVQGCKKGKNLRFEILDMRNTLCSGLKMW